MSILSYNLEKKAIKERFINLFIMGKDKSEIQRTLLINEMQTKELYECINSNHNKLKNNYLYLKNIEADLFFYIEMRSNNDSNFMIQSISDKVNTLVYIYKNSTLENPLYLTQD